MSYTTFHIENRESMPVLSNSQRRIDNIYGLKQVKKYDSNLSLTSPVKSKF